MLKNYFKIAIAVLRRRKFFTFISLFGISFTLSILMVATAFIDNVVNNAYPDDKRDRSLYVTQLSQSGKSITTGGSFSYYFLSHYAGSLKKPLAIGISSQFKGTNTYVKNRRIALNYKYTNAAYWDILAYKFLEGKPFTGRQVAAGERVTVISEDIRDDYFGKGSTAVGKYIEANNTRYRVCGVVKGVPVTTHILYSDIYLPYTVSNDYTTHEYGGDYSAILLASSPDDLPALQQEFNQMIKKVPMESKEYTTIYAHADPYIESYVRLGNENNSGMTYALIALTVFVLLITLLPTLNLVNINITRIMERSSEIGVRKAFGASSNTLACQFIVENLILTFLGGLIGIVISMIAIHYLNRAQLVANLELSINLTVLFYALATCIFFGLLSGVYPAWRMSKLNVVTALKSDQI